MALNTAFTGMPWLVQPGDAGQSLAQGASAGAAIAAAAARRSEGRLRAAQMQHQATIDLAEEERRKQEYAQQAEQAAIRADGSRRMLEEAESTGQTIEKLFPKYAPKILYGSPAAMQHFYSNLQSVEQRREAADALNRLRGETQERLREKDKDIEGFREREVKVKEELAKERSEKVPADEFTNREIDKLEDQARRMDAEGDTAGAKIAREQAKRRTDAMIPPKTPANEETEKEFVARLLPQWMRDNTGAEIEEGVAALKKVFKMAGEDRPRFIFDTKAGALK